MDTHSLAVQDAHLETAATSPAVADILCPVCGYDLRAISSDKCPECGLPIDRAAISVSRIPWEHRSHIGVLIAFWRTAGSVILRPAQFAKEVNRPVDLRSARQFQLTSVTLGWIAQCVWNAGTPLLDNRPHFGGGWPRETAMIMAICLAIWLYNWLASSIPSAWFHPPGMSDDQKERAVALSYYASAPLAILLLPAVMLVAWFLLHSVHALSDSMEPAIPLAAVLVIAAIFIYGYYLTIQLMRLTTRAQPGRALAMAVVLPAQWALCALPAALVPLCVYSLSIAMN